jgi:aspartyl-tRNA(Asn)/glutamyl-tRNA(Gln) amidotransferase subunit C
MKITREQVLHVAKLAQIRLAGDEAARFQREFDSILAYMDILREADTTGTPPTHHPLPLTNALREDSTRPSQSLDEALLNAPKHEKGFFVVPGMIE